LYENAVQEDKRCLLISHDQHLQLHLNLIGQLVREYRAVGFPGIEK